jgi:hypothetical protein
MRENSNFASRVKLIGAIKPPAQNISVSIFQTSWLSVTIPPQ